MQALTLVYLGETRNRADHFSFGHASTRRRKWLEGGIRWNQSNSYSHSTRWTGIPS